MSVKRPHAIVLTLLQRCLAEAIVVDDKGVGEAPSCRCVDRAESSWFTMAVGKGPPIKVFGGDDLL